MEKSLLVFGLIGFIRCFAVFAETPTPTPTPAWRTPVNISEIPNPTPSTTPITALRRFPCIAVDNLNINDYGRAHIVWTEQQETGGLWKIFYRGVKVNRYDQMELSALVEASLDHGVARDSDPRKPQHPFVWIDPDSEAENPKAQIAFSFRNNTTMYKGVEQSEVLFYPDVEATWTGPGEREGPTFLHHISGFGQHVKDAFILYDLCLEDLRVLWNQHDHSNDADHDIFSNYQHTELLEPGFYWCAVSMLTDTDEWPTPSATPTPIITPGTPIPAVTPQPAAVCEFFPYASTYASEGTYTIHIVSEEKNHYFLVHHILTAARPSCQYAVTTNYLQNTDASYYPSTAVDSAGNLYIAYHHFIEPIESPTPVPGESRYYLIKYDGSYSQATPLGVFGDGPESDAIRPVLGIDSMDNLYVAYVDDSYDVRIKQLDLRSATWVRDDTIGDTGDDQRWVHLAIDPVSDKPNIVYQQKSSDFDHNIYWTRLE